MEIRDLPEKEFKVTVKKCSLRSRRNVWTKWEYLQRNRIYKKVLNRNHRAEEYKDCYKYKLFHVSITVSTKQKPIVDTQNIKRKKSMHTISANYQSTKKE